MPVAELVRLTWTLLYESGYTTGVACGQFSFVVFLFPPSLSVLGFINASTEKSGRLFHLLWRYYSLATRNMEIELAWLRG